MNQSVIQNKKENTTYQIRLVFSVFVILFALLSIKYYQSVPGYTFSVMGTLILIMIVFAPQKLKPAYLAWMRIARVVGWVNTRILLFAVFALVVIPAGMLMKIFGKDPMQRGFKTDKSSYWETCRLAGLSDKNRYKRQF